MADLSKIKLNGVTYNIKDVTARSDISSLTERILVIENIPWVTYHTGNTTPSNSFGNDGDLYLETN